LLDLQRPDPVGLDQQLLGYRLGTQDPPGRSVIAQSLFEHLSADGDYLVKLPVCLTHRNNAVEIVIETTKVNKKRKRYKLIRLYLLHLMGLSTSRNPQRFAYPQRSLWCDVVETA